VHVRQGEQGLGPARMAKLGPARPEILDGWDPYRVRPAEDYPSPERWETGTQNHEGLAGFVAAVDYLAEAGRTFGTPPGAQKTPRPASPLRPPTNSLSST